MPWSIEIDGASAYPEAIAASNKPVCYSHCCPSGLKEHPRNKTDEQLKEIADAGGFVGVTMFAPFLKRGPDATVEVDPHRIGPVRTSYSPQTDGAPDPGEIVWTWVPCEENDGRGKDRPVLVVAEYDGLLAVRGHQHRPRPPRPAAVVQEGHPIHQLARRRLVDAGQAVERAGRHQPPGRGQRHRVRHRPDRDRLHRPPRVAVPDADRLVRPGRRDELTIPADAYLMHRDVVPGNPPRR